MMVDLHWAGNIPSFGQCSKVLAKKPGLVLTGSLKVLIGIPFTLVTFLSPILLHIFRSSGSIIVLSSIIGGITRWSNRVATVSFSRHWQDTWDHTGLSFKPMVKRFCSETYGSLSFPERTLQEYTGLKLRRGHVSLGILRALFFESESPLVWFGLVVTVSIIITDLPSNSTGYPSTHVRKIHCRPQPISLKAYEVRQFAIRLLHSKIHVFNFLTLIFS